MKVLNKTVPIKQIVGLDFSFFCFLGFEAHEMETANKCSSAAIHTQTQTEVNYSIIKNMQTNEMNMQKRCCSSGSRDFLVSLFFSLSVSCRKYFVSSFFPNPK